MTRIKEALKNKEKVAIFREIFGTHIFDRFTGVLKSKVRVLEEKEKALKTNGKHFNKSSENIDFSPFLSH